VSLNQPERDGIARSAQLSRVDELGGRIRVVAQQERDVTAKLASPDVVGLQLHDVVEPQGGIFMVASRKTGSGRV
jgi:hypothetical protein